MKNKLFNIKNSLALKMDKLNKEELSYVTGGRTDSAAGSSGSHSGTPCDATSVHCCYLDIQIECH